MNYIKKMCVLRQVKQGFSGDGRSLSGLVKAEQYGRNLSVEVSVVNFAPLSSGEYYCLLADESERCELLPLRGKSVFNILSDLNLENGFCAVVCFVRGEVVPIAYGVNGGKIYDFRALIKNVSQKVNGKETEVASSLFSSEQTEGTIERNFSLYSPPYERVEEEREETEAQEPPTNEPSENTQAESERGEYDDESVASENYYRRENREPYVYEKSDADEESGGENAFGSEAQGAYLREDVDAQSVGGSDERESFYRTVKRELDELFQKYEKDETLLWAYPASEWVRVEEGGRLKYLVGVIYEELQVKYIAYALPAKKDETPPDEIREVCSFIPRDEFALEDGFFILFQSPKTGECVKKRK